MKIHLFNYKKYVTYIGKLELSIGIPVSYITLGDFFSVSE